MTTENKYLKGSKSVKGKTAMSAGMAVFITLASVAGYLYLTNGFNYTVPRNTFATAERVCGSSDKIAEVLIDSASLFVTCTDNTKIIVAK